MASRWLLKTEPGEYPFEALVREGRGVWDGVTNPLALRHLRAVREGDQALIYHTGSQRAVVGRARVVRGPYPDPAAGDPRIVAVDVAPVGPLARPVTLRELKADPRFRAFELIRLPRLSVMPVPAELWRAILALTGRRGA